MLYFCLAVSGSLGSRAGTAAGFSITVTTLSLTSSDERGRFTNLVNSQPMAQVSVVGSVVRVASIGSIRRIDSKVELFLWLTLARMRTWTHWTTKSPSNLDHQMMTHLSRRGLSHKIAYVAHIFPAEQDQSRSDAAHRKTLTFSRKLEI